MASALTLNEVLSFSEGFQFEAVGLTGGTFLTAMFGIGFTILAILLLVKAKSIIASVCVMAIGIGLFQLTYISMTNVSAEDQERYAQEKEVWKKEYAIPYYEQLPVERFENLQSVSYSKELAFKAEDYIGHDRYKYQGERYETPINLITEDGEEHRFWAEVIYQPELESNYVEYIYVEQDIIFHEFESRPLYNEGFNGVKLYTNKRI